MSHGGKTHLISAFLTYIRWPSFTQSIRSPSLTLRISATSLGILVWKFWEIFVSPIISSILGLRGLILGFIRFVLEVRVIRDLIIVLGGDKGVGES